MEPAEEVSISNIVLEKMIQANEPEIDDEGFVTCPDCGVRVNCGTVGISNLMKRHRGKKKCLELKARRDKKKRHNGQVPDFFFGNNLSNIFYYHLACVELDQVGLRCLYIFPRKGGEALM